MRNTGKALLATVIAGLGAGAVRLAYGKRGTIANGAKHAKRRVLRHLYPGNSYYSQLTPEKKQVVDHIADLILTKKKGFRLQVEANRYLQVVKYLRNRYEFHVSHASRILGIPYVATYNIAVALVRQGVLDHNARSQNYVRKDKVADTLHMLKPLYHKYSVVIPSEYIPGLKESITVNKYW